MSLTAVKTTLATDVAPGGTFTVPYPTGYGQSDFLANDATTSVYGADHDNLGVTLNASDITITWPAGKSTTLTAGTELTIGLDLKNTVDDSRVGDLLPFQADVTDNSSGTADATVAAVSGSGADAAINDNFADLAARHNALLQKLRDSGLMESS